MSDRKNRPSRDDFDDLEHERRFKWDDDDRYSAVRHSAQDAVRRATSRGNKRRPEGGQNLMKKPGAIIALVLGGVAIVALATYILVARSTQPATPSPATTQSKPKQPPASTTDQPPDQGGGLPIPGVTSPQQPSTPEAQENLLTTGARITLKLALAALLAAMLAFRPRKDLPSVPRNPYVAQTQILLAVVAAALMMVVADNAARAFGIFAAASLVRFRTNIRDPKEITVLLISLGIGLASGVGKVEVAVILSLFVLLMLWVLEYYEPAQVFRALELTVMTRKVDETDEILREIFEKHNITTELRLVDREDEAEPFGKIVYSLNINPSTSTDHLSEEIFSSDPDNIDSVKWDQKKSNSYIYR
ncbi:MAG TPA: DUF4956 domain-containing protein [Blastocatellia bacterium]|nr:DUF4956 domain-containing protein [Blastocatellia bacterium]